METLLHLGKLQQLPEMIEQSMSDYIQTPSLLAQALTCACCACRIESGRSVGPHTPGKAGDSLQLAFRPSGLTGFIFTKNATIYEALYAVLNGVE